MKFPELRRTLHRIVLAGLPALALAACDPAADLPASADAGRVGLSRVVRIVTPAPPQLQAMLNACAAGQQAVCMSLCQDFLCNETGYMSVTSCTLGHEGTDAILTIGYDETASCATPGRRPAGLRIPHELAASGPAGAWLAHAAHLEAASVHAFVALARELLHHGAPAELCRAALVAARDEVGHAELMGALAARYGATPPPLHVEARELRSIEAIALENAIEGCVRETWAALLALYQARAAGDPEVRAVMARIAEDELGHAALAWAVDRWASARLDPAARARVASARAAAAAELLGAPTTAIAPELVDRLGLPDLLHTRRLLVDAHAAVWS